MKWNERYLRGLGGLEEKSTPASVKAICEKIQSLYRMGKLSKAMQFLLDLSKKLEDAKLRNDANLIAARFAVNEHRFMRETMTNDQYQVEQVKSLQYLLEEVEKIL